MPAGQLFRDVRVAIVVDVGVRTGSQDENAEPGSGLPTCEAAAVGDDVWLRFIPAAPGFRYSWWPDDSDVVPVQSLEDILADVDRNHQRRLRDLGAADC